MATSSQLIRRPAWPRRYPTYLTAGPRWARRHDASWPELRTTRMCRRFGKRSTGRAVPRVVGYGERSIARLAECALIWPRAVPIERSGERQGVTACGRLSTPGLV